MQLKNVENSFEIMSSSASVCISYRIFSLRNVSRLIFLSENVNCSMAMIDTLHFILFDGYCADVEVDRCNACTNRSWFPNIARHACIPSIIRDTRGNWFNVFFLFGSMAMQLFVNLGLAFETRIPFTFSSKFIASNLSILRVYTRRKSLHTFHFAI